MEVLAILYESTTTLLAFCHLAPPQYAEHLPCRRNGKRLGLDG
jgi:hypothetical protein